jgi:CRISPR system Cascade subunit CasB
VARLENKAKKQENPAKKAVKTYVGGQILRLTSGGESSVRANLARLRRGVGRVPGAVPELWELTLGGLPQELFGDEGNPSGAEWACYIALTLFALHQQGHDAKAEPMNADGNSLGNAARALVSRGFSHGNEDAENGVKRRFNAAATSQDTDELAHHLRGLVQMLRAAGVALDYPKLAADLLDFQNPARRDGVRLSWGQDYYRNRIGKEEITDGKSE